MPLWRWSAVPLLVFCDRRRLCDPSRPDAQGAFDIGSSAETSLLRLVEHLRAPTGYQGPITFGAARPGEQRRSCLTIRQAQSALHWQPATGLDAGLRATVRWVAQELAERAC